MRVGLLTEWAVNSRDSLSRKTKLATTITWLKKMFVDSDIMSYHIKNEYTNVKVKSGMLMIHS